MLEITLLLFGLASLLGSFLLGAVCMSQHIDREKRSRDNANQQSDIALVVVTKEQLAELSKSGTQEWQLHELN